MQWHGWKGWIGMELFRFEENEDGAALVEFLASRDETITEVEIPDTYQGKPVIRIGERVFSYCHFLKKVKLPKNLVCLDDEIFMTCPALECVEFPEEVMQNESVTFGKQVFSGCQKLPAETILMGALGACSLDTPMTQRRLNENLADTLRADVLRLALEHHVLDKINQSAVVKYMKELDLTDHMENLSRESAPTHFTFCLNISIRQACFLLFLSYVMPTARILPV